MKKIIITCFIACVAMTGFSQEMKQNSVGLSVGPSLPLSGTTFERDGLNVNMSFTHMLSQKIGVTTLVTGSFLPFDEYQIKADLENNQSTSWGNCNVNAKAHKSYASMTGIQYMIKRNDRVALSLRALGGLSSTTIPYFEVSFQPEGILETPYTQRVKTKTHGMAYNLGAELKYSASDNFTVNFNVDYFQTGDYEYIAQYRSTYITTSYNERDMKKLLNISFGVSRTFY